jgi:hypothetical protein
MLDLPDEFNKLAQKMRSNANQHAYNLRQNAARREANCEDTVKLLAKATDNYLQTAVARIQSPLYTAGYRERDSIDRVTAEDSGSNLFTYFREIALRLERPFLYVYDRHVYTRGGGILSMAELTVPRNKRLEKVVGGLMILGQSVDDVSAMTHAAGPVGRCDTKGQWHFFFIGDDGPSLLDMFVEQCRTDPVFRLCLNNKYPVR